MKKITENELKNKVSRLREYLAVIEATTPGMGQKGPTVAAAQGADPSNPLNQAPYNAAKDSQAANVPATQSTKPAAAPAPAKPAASAKPAAKSDPNVKALQDKLIAAGAKIKADGIMGPATRAAQAQFPNVTTQTDAEKAVAADYLSANDGTGQNGGAAQVRNPNAGLTPDDSRWQGPKPSAATGVGIPGEEAAADADFLKRQQETNAQTAADTQATNAAAAAQAERDDAAAVDKANPAAPAPAPAPAPLAADGGPAPTPEQLKWLGGADQTDKFILARMRKAVPNAPAAAPAPASTAPAGAVVQGGMAAESVGFDEIQRLVSLVQYR